MTNLDHADSPQTQRSGAHLPALDGLRGMAILGVMIFHQTSLEASTASGREFQRLAGFFQVGVDLFFVLSGFLITGILLDAKGSRHYFRNFYARRVLRIFPLYYLVLTVGLVILPAISHPMSQKWRDEGGLSQWWYWLFLSNWWIALRGYGPRNGLIDLSWTLSIEEQFYLIWPFVVGWFGRKGLIRMCIGLIATAFAFRLSLAVAGAPDAWPHMMTPARLDALGVGALIALLVRGRRGVAGLLRPAACVAGATLPMLAVLVLSPGWVPGWHVLSIACGGTAMAAFFGALLVMALDGRPGSVASRVFGNSTLRAFGIYSYGLYLFHNPIQSFLRHYFFNPRTLPIMGSHYFEAQILFYVAATVPAFCCAWLSWTFFERPIARLKRYFPPEPRPSVAATRPPFGGPQAGRWACTSGDRDLIDVAPERRVP